MKNKQLLTMFFIAIVTIGICFTGCKKEEEEKTLKGTTWMCNGATLRFISESMVTESDYGTGTYTYSHPTIMVTWSDSYWGTSTGSVSENMIMLDGLMYTKL